MAVIESWSEKELRWSARLDGWQGGTNTTSRQAENLKNTPTGSVPMI
jgi:hypothetical protein